MGKSVQQRKQNKDDWFDSVVQNAILFLNSSFENLENSPRSSVIDLYTAIELLFKARLMKEHWALIITRPEDAKITSFENGNFHSVYLEQSEKRLTNICGEKFKKEAMDNFKALGEHRNQIVHFAHTGFGENRKTVIFEHWASWYYLYDLVTKQWSEIFDSYLKHFERFNKRIYRNTDFLQVKYDAIDKDIENEKKKGTEVLTCPSCHFNSAVVKKTNYWGKDFECLVCDVKDEIPKEIKAAISCEHCDKLVSYFLLRSNECNHCSGEISEKYALDEYIKIYHEGYEDDEDLYHCLPVGHCHNCESETATVVVIEGVEVCVSCGVQGWRIMFCEHCSEYVTGDRNKIVHFACHLCEDEVRKGIEESFAQFEAECGE
ncbi:hypothetical protein V9R55_003536 [Vibrio cholerae]